MGRFTVLTKLFLILAIFVITSCIHHTNIAINQSVDTKEIISKADKLFSERRNLDKLRTAILVLRAARNPDNRNFEVEWKFSKYSCILGRLTTDDKEAEKVLTEGALAGTIASRIEPQKPDGYYWYAANLGEQARRSPVTIGLRSIIEIRSVMERSIEIDPKYDNAGAFDTIGMVELETQFVGGNLDKATEVFEKGYKLAPTSASLQLHLARAYLAKDKLPEAKRLLLSVTMPESGKPYDPEDEIMALDAERLLKTRF